jgi:hypothetical protein
MSPLAQSEIQSFLSGKYGISEEVSKKIATLIRATSIKSLLELAELVDDKNKIEEWEFYWHNLLNPVEDELEL